jgi:hypothetical protein
MGDIAKISLGDGTHTYARVLAEASFTFYDSRTTEELPAKKGDRTSCALFAAVLNHAMNRGAGPSSVVRPSVTTSAVLPHSFKIPGKKAA